MAKNEENFKEKSRPKSDFAPEDAFANTRKESTHRCFQRHRRAKDFPPHTKIRALLLVGDLDHTFYPRGWSTAWDPDRVRKIHLSILHQMAFLSDHFNESKYQRNIYCSDNSESDHFRKTVTVTAELVSFCGSLTKWRLRPWNWSYLPFTVSSHHWRTT